MINGIIFILRIGDGMTNNIEIDIKSKEDMFNKFNEDLISEDLGNFIFKQSKKISLTSKVTIEIYDKVGLTKEERGRLIDAIREYFGLMVKEKLIYIDFNNVRKIFLFVIGVVLILLSNALTKVFSFLIPELFLIAGWVAIWETVYSIFFSDNQNRVEIKKLKELTKCDIRFKNSK